MASRSLGLRIKRLRGDARREAIAGVLAEYESSDRSAVAFCKSAGIAPVTLTRWKNELRRTRGHKPASPRFVEVRAPRPTGVTFFDVTLPGGVVVRVPSGFEAGDLTLACPRILPRRCESS